jgi:hypothetical protein
VDDFVDLALFDTGPFPSTKSVVDPEKLGDGWERDGVAAFFKGKSNADVTIRALEEQYPYDYSSFHHHLSADAFVFFLPGLMQLALLNREDDQAALLGDSLVNTLLRMAKGEMNDRLKPVVGAYSNWQLSAVAKFLAAVAKLDPYPIPEKDPALSALRLFWGQFLSDHAGSGNGQE